ncbi:MAG: GNAT family N-acetyltransferase [Elainellaceae cyanobacterium]
MERQEFTVHSATVQDYNALCQLFREVDVLHQQHLPEVFQHAEGSVKEHDYFLNLIADDNVALYLARLGQQITGFVHAAIQETPNVPIFVPRRYVVIVGIAVAAEYRDSGIGRVLMDHVHHWAFDKGARSIELNVYEFNKGAIAFYERLGYQTLSRRLVKSLDVTSDDGRA